MEKKTIFSGIQPSGKITIGNYLGAISNWVDLQDEYNNYYCIVDMHAITVPQVPKELRENTMLLVSQYLAAGLDPEKSTIFLQSHVPQHAELAWVLQTMTYMGELGRMTQYKDKSSKGGENLNAALFTYPVLMAADILLYGTDLVPVGEDQKQHLELARDLAQRFNNRYSDTFKVPEIYIPKVGAKIMSLQEPTKKMSKSDENENGYISLLDSNDIIIKKVKRAVTDSVGEVNYTSEQPGIKNLLEICSKFENTTPQELALRYQSKGYGEFKQDASEIISEGLRPIREKSVQYMQDKAYLESVYALGAQKAEDKAYKMLNKVYKKIGFIPKKRV